MTANRLLAYGTGRELGRFNRDRVWQRNRDTSRFATDASCRASRAKGKGSIYGL